MFSIVIVLIACTLTCRIASAAPSIKQSDLVGGLAVLVNPPNTDTAVRLASQYTVHCLLDNPDRTSDFQELANPRITSESWSHQRLPYGDNLVNLLIVYQADNTTHSQISRVLAPLGKVWIQVDARSESKPFNLKTISESDGWLQLQKAWPDDIDEWTHFLHGVDGNCVANDTRIADPRTMQWTSGPDYTQHHNRPNSLSAMISARGRLYSIINDAPPGAAQLPDRWSLVARDAFNGIKLWTLPIANWGWQSWSDKPVADGNGGRFTQPPHIARTLVAEGDTLYVTLGFGAAVSAVNGRTGKVIRTYQGTENTDEILALNGILYLAVHEQSLEDRTSAEASRRRTNATKSGHATKHMVAVEGATGRILWQSNSHIGISEKQQFMEIHRHFNPVLGENKVFFATKDNLVCLDAKTGKQIWLKPRPAAEEHLMRYQMRASDMITLVYHEGRIIYSQLEPTKRIGWRDVKATVSAYSATEGKRLWSRVCASWGWGSPADVLISQGLVWVHEFQNSTISGIDPATGKVVRTTSNKVAFDDGHHHRCYRNKATTNFILTSYRGIELIDWNDDRETSLNHWFRAACRYGFLPANGLLYNSPNPCECYVESKLNGFNALAPPSRVIEIAAQDRLVKGLAFGKVDPVATQSEDWPAFRHDTRRSGNASTTLSKDLTQIWNVDLGGIPTAPTVADKRVYIALPAERQLIALDAEVGKKLWQVATRGSVDSPPTWHRGTVIYGTSDGYVTCRSAADGRVVWQFMAAPSHRRIMASGRLESSWPVHGSVVIEADKAYVVAGRSSFIDGGFSSWVLDAATGEVIEYARLDENSNAGSEGRITVRERPGMTSDVLVSDGVSLFMHGRKMFAYISSSKQATLVYPVSGFLTHTWFNRVSHWERDGIVCGEAVVTDGENVFSFSAYKKRSTDSAFLRPGTDAYVLSRGKVISEDSIDRRGKNPGPKNLLKNDWSHPVPIGVRSMLNGGGTIVVGGSEDTVDPQDPLKNLDGRGKGLLLIVDAASGKQHSTIKLDSPPILDGMAAAQGRLYVACRSGKLICYVSRLV